MLKDKLSLEEMITKLLDGALPLYLQYMAIESYPDYNSVVQRVEKVEREAKKGFEVSAFKSPVAD